MTLTAAVMMNLRMMVKDLCHHHHLLSVQFDQKPSGLCKVSLSFTSDSIIKFSKCFFLVLPFSVWCLDSLLTTGVQICRDAFLQLMGIGRNRLIRTKHSFRGQDLRPLGVLAFS